MHATFSVTCGSLSMKETSLLLQQGAVLDFDHETTSPALLFPLEAERKKK